MSESILYPIKKILLPTDCSKYSINAAKYTVEIAKKHNSKVTLLHALDVQLDVHPIDLGSNLLTARIAIENEKEIKERSMKIMEKTKKVFDKTAVPIEMKYVCCGNPRESIVEIASKENFDLIVMGHKGITGIKHVMLGSVAEGVCQTAPCSVLIVR